MPLQSIYSQSPKNLFLPSPPLSFIQSPPPPRYPTSPSGTPLQESPSPYASSQAIASPIQAIQKDHFYVRSFGQFQNFGNHTQVTDNLYSGMAAKRPFTSLTPKPIHETRSSSSNSAIPEVPTHISTSNSTSDVPAKDKLTDPKKGFWEIPGMEAFLDWMTDPDNHQRLIKPRPISGQRACDIHAEIAKYVNSKHGTNWDKDIVKGRIQYTKKKYDKARTEMTATGAGDTETETLRERVLAICPCYDRLHAVWGGSLARNPPPPRQAGTITPIAAPTTLPTRPIDIPDTDTDTASIFNADDSFSEYGTQNGMCKISFAY